MSGRIYWHRQLNGSSQFRGKTQKYCSLCLHCSLNPICHIWKTGRLGIILHEGYIIWQWNQLILEDQRNYKGHYLCEFVMDSAISLGKKGWWGIRCCGALWQMGCSFTATSSFMFLQFLSLRRIVRCEVSTIAFSDFFIALRDCLRSLICQTLQLPWWSSFCSQFCWARQYGLNFFVSFSNN